MLLVWHRLVGKSSDGRHLLNWLVVHMLYTVTDFMMLNAHDFGRFVTLTLWHSITPKQIIHGFIT